jgi:ATP-dependent RNA helicase DHX8/PRP22
MPPTPAPFFQGGQGVLAGADEDAEEEFEIDLNDAEPEFLKGHSSKSGIEMSPIKIVKNPEGSLQRAAMTQVGPGGGGKGRAGGLDECF